MQLRAFLVVLWASVAVNSPGQSGAYPYVLKNFAGSFPLGDGGPAAAALLYTPSAVALDGSGNVFVLDSNNYRIRKVTPDGTITTAVKLQVYGDDLKVGRDGSFYVTSSSSSLVEKIAPGGSSPYGQITSIAGNGSVGSSGDGIPATTAPLSASLGGIALDSGGNVYFVDGNRVREVTADGVIHTVAGTATAGYNGDNQPAVSAQLNQPWGLAVDSGNNLYIADQFNSRVRKVVNGGITTIAGGTLGVPVDGAAAASPLGAPYGLAVDSSGNVYITDIGLYWTVRIGADGSLTHVAGNGPEPPDSGYSDGAATASYLYHPAGIAVNGSGTLFIAEEWGDRVRQLSDGNLRTFAGQLHFAGDGGPAAAALLNEPADVALDGKGNTFIADNSNYRIREVLTDGTIHTVAGNGIYGTPDDGVQAASAPLPDVWAIATDVNGNAFLATTHKVLKVTPTGVVTTVAGTGAFGDAGDGFPANKAAFEFLTGIAVDASGNIYVADSEANRVRKISAADGTISAFAGAGGKGGYFGDSGQATYAKLNLYYSYAAPLATDSQGSLYIGDYGNYVVRKVDASGVIGTYAGTGAFGQPVDGAQAKSALLSPAAGLAADFAGNLYIVSDLYSAIYRVDTAGLIQRISGGGPAAPADGLPATSTSGFNGAGVKVDGNRDLYVADPSGMLVRKLVYNSPTSLSIVSGNNQSGTSGSALPAPLTVLVNGRGGAGVAGASVNFSVTSGAATLSTLSATTDATGMAQVNVTLGQVGAITSTVAVSASVAGSTAAAVSFTLFANQPNANCPVPAPAITSVRSLGDFGGLPSFASGSWLEVRGTNLATDTRSWADADFHSGVAPTSLDGTSVTIDGIPGFVSYVSPQQVNVVAPADPATGQVQVTAANCAGSSAPYPIQKNATAPGLLAPAAFNFGGKQYLAATLPDGATYVGSPGYAATKPGDALHTFGIGFGTVNPPATPGSATSQADSIPGFTLAFGSTPSTVSYAGLAPGVIGLYQINFTTPNVASGDYQIMVSVGGTAVQQVVYLTVQ
ncbi:MAG TPA: hypothetical protein VN841_14835 [Bryobacteraceae bacterium]|nr:hypothetical protein [Bryobacteraceae bacterium]